MVWTEWPSRLTFCWDGELPELGKHRVGAVVYFEPRTEIEWSRRAIINVIATLSAHSASSTLVGAHAGLLRTAGLNGVPMMPTGDGDLGVTPGLVGDVPSIESLLTDAGYEHRTTARPGLWGARTVRRGRHQCIPREDRPPCAARTVRDSESEQTGRSTAAAGPRQAGRRKRTGPRTGRRERAKSAFDTFVDPNEIDQVFDRRQDALPN